MIQLITSKICTKCKILKSKENFVKSSQTKDLLYSWCKSCKYPKTKVWLKENQVKVSESSKRRNVRQYNISLEDKYHLLKLQEGVCAICKKPETSIKRGNLAELSVDHDHITGEVRGLLCSGCNLGIGCFKDSTEALHSAIKYLSCRKK